ncbi:hypothetical protein ABT234_40395 [Streptomyces sp. NPDC001586]|uniref:alpha/beta fold hydrolase n=1 Tax=Streptomyces sp. NPDC001586 TaxID=3154387 RepID=UPI003325BD30
MDSIYRSAEGREHIRSWCTGRLDAWPVPHERTTITANGARTHVVTAGSGPVTVVFVAGTNFNASASLPLATALVEAGHRVVLPDVPGQPGLGTSGTRVSAAVSGVPARRPCSVPAVIVTRPPAHTRAVRTALRAGQHLAQQFDVPGELTVFIREWP